MFKIVSLALAILIAATSVAQACGSLPTIMLIDRDLKINVVPILTPTFGTVRFRLDDEPCTVSISSSLPDDHFIKEGTPIELACAGRQLIMGKLEGLGQGCGMFMRWPALVSLDNQSPAVKRVSRERAQTVANLMVLQIPRQ